MKCEPQVLGTLQGKTQLFASSTEGESSSWIRINLDEIRMLKITHEGFAEPKTYPSVEEKHWDRKIKETDYGGWTVSSLIKDYEEDEEDELD
jgi:hypothetical protein